MSNPAKRALRMVEGEDGPDPNDVVASSMGDIEVLSYDEVFQRIEQLAKSKGFSSEVMEDLRKFATDAEYQPQCPEKLLSLFSVQNDLISRACAQRLEAIINARSST